MRNSNNKPAAVEAAAVDWLTRLDAGLSEKEKAEYERWLKENPLHEQAVSRYARVWSLLDHPKEGGRSELMLRELKRRQRVRRAQRTSLLAGAAALLLMAFVFWRKPQTAAPSQAGSGTAQIFEPERKILPDGSTVELNAGAELAVEFTDAERRVRLLKGEAHFAVAKNAKRPFVVYAGSVDFKAVGTAFAVQLGERQVDLLVTQGRVAVETAKSGTAEAQPASRASPTLKAYDVVRVDLAAAAPPVVHQVEAISQDEMARRLFWRSPRIELTDAPLAEAVRLVNRYGAVRFVIEDASLETVEVSGYLRADNTDAFLLLVRDSLGLEAVRLGREIHLRKRPDVRGSSESFR